MKKYSKWAFVIMWAVVIFVFSTQSVDVSNNNNRFIMDILNKIGINFDAVTGGIGNFIIRKAAHFTEYFILYLLLYNALIDNFYFGTSLLFSLMLTFIYASTDEFHQMFVPGRGPAIRDVGIDTLGGFCCLLFIYIKSVISKKRHRTDFSSKFK